jgi:hypothetical protein
MAVMDWPMLDHLKDSLRSLGKAASLQAEQRISRFCPMITGCHPIRSGMTAG